MLDPGPAAIAGDLEQILPAPALNMDISGISHAGNFNVYFSMEHVMKLSLLRRGVLVAALTAAMVPAAHAVLPTDLLGEPAPLYAASRTILIEPGTRWVNVTGGEIVKFVVGDKAFAWHFNGIAGTFDLTQIAPQGVLTHSVRTYQAPDPLYIN